MDRRLQDSIEGLAKPYYQKNKDPAHDWTHISYVMNYATEISRHVQCDPYILHAAISFHDAVNHPKDSPRRKDSARESADVAERELAALSDFPKDKIYDVKTVIIEHSYSAGLKASTLESKIVQDSDRIDSLGERGIERITQTALEMGSPIYCKEDPFCKKRKPDPKASVFDFILGRALPLQMNTKKGKELAQPGKLYMMDYLESYRDILEPANPMQKVYSVNREIQPSTGLLIPSRVTI